MATNNNISMQTSIQNLPINNKNDINDDTDDPQVQDILKEFEDEIIATQKPNNIPQRQQQIPIYQPQPQPQPRQIPYQSNKINSLNDYINYDIIKKCAIIVILIILILNTNFLNYILSQCPNKISNILSNYEMSIKNIIIFLILYILFFYNVL